MPLLSQLNLKTSCPLTNRGDEEGWKSVRKSFAVHKVRSSIQMCGTGGNTRGKKTCVTLLTTTASVGGFLSRASTGGIKHAGELGGEIPFALLHSSLERGCRRRQKGNDVKEKKKGAEKKKQTFTMYNVVVKPGDRGSLGIHNQGHREEEESGDKTVHLKMISCPQRPVPKVKNCGGERERIEGKMDIHHYRARPAASECLREPTSQREGN